ncbi:MAG TPA: hypothetical protein VJS67_14790, partial [Pseudonocardiaceae bacterium]|nr:hypothetical protein [Pseudonocardiaceae bacterium]
MAGGGEVHRVLGDVPGPAPAPANCSEFADGLVTPSGRRGSGCAPTCHTAAGAGVMPVGVGLRGVARSGTGTAAGFPAGPAAKLLIVTTT